MTKCNLEVYIFAFCLFCTFADGFPAMNCTQVSIVHLNDFHARFEETSIDSGICKSKTCIGGFSRIYASIMKILKENPQTILLNAGDNFEGTGWYKVHKWNVTQHFFNKLPFDAYTLGNHEFEDKIEGLIPFLQQIKSPVVVSNIDASLEPKFQSLVNKSIIIEKNGLKIGIIGVILSTTNELASVGNLTLLNELESINTEADRLVKKGVFTNIVLSHCGYEVELALARKSKSKISVIVGAHSHTFLYTGEPSLAPDKPLGPYPTVVDNDEGKKVLVVQAASYSKYLGNISVFYNENGDVDRWEGNPIFLDTSVPQDLEINEELLPWKAAVDQLNINNTVLGKTLVRLGLSSCATGECLIGNFLTDAMVFGYTESPEEGTWTKSSIAVIHAGGIRGGIDMGDITYNDIVSVQPFNNTIDIGEIKGAHLKEIFELSVSRNSLNLLQVSGIRIHFNLSMPIGSRVISLKLRCRKCQVPIYEDLDENKTYRITLLSYLADGGFDFDLFKTYLKNREIGMLDTQLFSKYVECKSPIFQEIQGRIQIYR